MNKFAGATALITGASGGIGAALVEECITRKVKKIYATDINLSRLAFLQQQYPDIVVPLKLDVTNIEAVTDCQKQCSDVDILFNNAGIECATNFLDEKALKAASLEMAVNYIGVHNLCHAFWHGLKAKPSACIVNILSVASFILILKLGTYCASKSATHFLTQALRYESKGTNLNVYAVYPGYVDTQMTEALQVKKATPQQIAINTCDSIEQGVLDIFPDDMASELIKSYPYENHIFSSLDR